MQAVPVKYMTASRMTLEEVIDVICKAHAQTEEPDIVRLHTGDPSIYGRNQRTDGSSG